jgi:transposase
MIPAGVQIFVALESIDLRFSFERLSGLAKEQVGYDARSGALFVFFGKRRDAIKILFFDGGRGRRRGARSLARRHRRRAPRAEGHCARPRALTISHTRCDRRHHRPASAARASAAVSALTERPRPQASVTTAPLSTTGLVQPVR